MASKNLSQRFADFATRATSRIIELENITTSLPEFRKAVSDSLYNLRNSVINGFDAIRKENNLAFSRLDKIEAVVAGIEAKLEDLSKTPAPESQPVGSAITESEIRALLTRHGYEVDSVGVKITNNDFSNIIEVTVSGWSPTERE